MTAISSLRFCSVAGLHLNTLSGASYKIHCTQRNELCHMYTSNTCACTWYKKHWPYMNVVSGASFFFLRFIQKMWWNKFILSLIPLYRVLIPLQIPNAFSGASFFFFYFIQEMSLPYLNASCHLCEQVTLRVDMNAYENSSSGAAFSVTSFKKLLCNIQMRHATYVNESCSCLMLLLLLRKR